MKEEEIRNRDSLATYLELVREDCRRLLSHDQFVSISCPACEGDDSLPEFCKEGFEYHTCCSCETLFARTRPSFAALERFYTESLSTRFWINDFFRPVAEARRQKIFRPRAKYVVEQFGKDPLWRIGDIGAGFGIFCDELRKLWPSSSYMAIEPSSEQAEICRYAGIPVIESSLESVTAAGNFDLLTAFELLEHLHQPRRFVAAAHDMLKPGGWLLMTTLNGLGFDIQVLWEHSKSIYPPCHINFFNPRSVTQMLEAIGFKVYESVTPGQLDWSIVEGAVAHGDVPGHRFWKLLARRTEPHAKEQLQKWIVQSGLSSHMRILAQKI